MTRPRPRPRLTEAKCRRAIDAIVAVIETGHATGRDRATLDAAADAIRRLATR